MHRPKTTPRVTLAGLLALGLAGASSSPLTAEPPPVQKGVRAAVEVRALDVDVVATKDGQPVEDLTRDELVVKVEGKRYPLDYFARISAGSVHGPDLANASPDFVLQTLADPQGGRFVPRQFLVFFDDAHLLPFERGRVIDSLRDLVTRLSPSDNASLVSWGTSTQVLVPYTSSKEALLDGLSRLAAKPPRGVVWEQDFTRTMLELRRTGRASTREAMIRGWSTEVAQRERATLNELRRSIAALAARSGKRVLLLVSNGLEMRPGQTLVQAMGPNLLQQFEHNLAPELNAVIAEANRAGITVNALDAKGLVAEGDTSERDAPAFSAFFRSQSLREPLASLASETGGLLIENRNEWKASIDQVYREASTYYSAGITLTSLEAAKASVDVSISCTREGVKVRSRRSFGVKSADEAARDRMEMALMTPDSGTDFPASLSTGTPKGGGLGRRLVPFQVTVPISALTFSDEPGGKKCGLEVALAAVDDTGARSEIATDRKELRIGADRWESALKETYRYSGEMKSRTGNVRFVATVRDLASGRIAVASASVRVE